MVYNGVSGPQAMVYVFRESSIYGLQNMGVVDTCSDVLRKALDSWTKLSVASGTLASAFAD